MTVASDGARATRLISILDHELPEKAFTLWEGWVRRPNLKVDHLDNRWRPAEVFQGDIVGNERLFVIADRGSIHGNDANVFNYYIGDFQIKQRASRDVSGLLSYGNLPPTSLPQLIRRSDQPIGYVDEQSVEGGNKSSANLIGVGEDEGPEAFLLGFLVLGLVPFYLALLAAFLIDPLSPIERRSRDGDIKKRRKDDQADWD